MRIMSELLGISRVLIIIVIITTIIIIIGVRNLRIFYNTIYNAFIVIANPVTRCIYGPRRTDDITTVANTGFKIIAV